MALTPEQRKHLQTLTTLMCAFVQVSAFFHVYSECVKKDQTASVMDSIVWSFGETDL